MEAVILAGGFGTRLAHIVKDVPKPMAPIAGRPFLQYLLAWCENQGVSRAIVAVGYKKEVIEDYFGERYHNIELVYSSEEIPLFTGGALKKALSVCKAGTVVVANGDTLFDVDLRHLSAFHRDEGADITVAVKPMQNFERYGTVQMEGHRIVGFEEKTYRDEGIINGGVYVINRERLASIRSSKFSFEKDVLAQKVHEWNINAFVSDGYFIDIGVEQDYFRAQKELCKIL